MQPFALQIGILEFVLISLQSTCYHAKGICVCVCSTACRLCADLVRQFKVGSSDVDITWVEFCVASAWTTLAVFCCRAIAKAISAAAVNQQPFCK